MRRLVLRIKRPHRWCGSRRRHLRRRCNCLWPQSANDWGGAALAVAGCVCAACAGNCGCACGGGAGSGSSSACACNGGAGSSRCATSDTCAFACARSGGCGNGAGSATSDEEPTSVVCDDGEEPGPQVLSRTPPTRMHAAPTASHKLDGDPLSGAVAPEIACRSSSAASGRTFALPGARRRLDRKAVGCSSGSQSRGSRIAAACRRCCISNTL